MIIKASGRSALILAAGLFVGFNLASPVSAATGNASKADGATIAKPAKQTARHGKRSAHRKSEKPPAQAADAKSDTITAAATDVADAAGTTMPASIANANAQLAADAPVESASAMTAKANTLIAAGDQPVEPQVAPSDQINDIDRALQPSSQAVAQVQPAAQPQTVAVASTRTAPVLASGESSTWDQTSVIGKVFIAFGALLTMASAARMFMA